MKAWLKRLWEELMSDPQADYAKARELLKRRLESPENRPEAEKSESRKSL